jgi:hypothetical protein
MQVIWIIPKDVWYNDLFLSVDVVDRRIFSILNLKMGHFQPTFLP